MSKIKPFFVKAKPSAKNESVEKIDGAHFVVVIKKPAKDGRANEAIARALADYFEVAPSRVLLLSGFTSRQKVFEIL